MRRLYPVTIVMSMAWLSLFATVMTNVMQWLGCALGISTTVMGLSLGAIGTSFPNLYASILVAKAGQGGMSICQAIASNTFNVCICLGLLWLLHAAGLGGCSYGSHGGRSRGACAGCYAPSGFEPMCPYFKGTSNEYGSVAGSTKGAVLVVFVWYLVFIVAIVKNRNVLTRGAAVLMLVLYALYLVYELAAARDVVPALCFHALNICL